MPSTLARSIDLGQAQLLNDDDTFDITLVNDALTWAARQSVLNAIFEVSEIPSSSHGYGMLVHRPTGQVLFLENTNYYNCARGEIARTLVGALPGSANLGTGQNWNIMGRRAPCASNETIAVYAYDPSTNIQVGYTNSAGVLQTPTSLSGYTTPSDLIWCPGGSQFLLAHDAGVVKSANGTSWSDSTLSGTFNSITRLATDGGSQVLAVSEHASGNNDVFFSTDGGDTFTAYAHNMDGGDAGQGAGQMDMQTAAYDPLRGLWLVGDYYSDAVWQSSDPTNTSGWSSAFTLPVVGGSAIDKLTDFQVLPGGTWYLSCSQVQFPTTSEAHYISTDAGSSWQCLGAWGYETRIADGRLYHKGGASYHLTERFQ